MNRRGYAAGKLCRSFAADALGEYYVYFKYLSASYVAWTKCEALCLDFFAGSAGITNSFKGTAHKLVQYWLQLLKLYHANGLRGKYHIQNGDVGGGHEGH